MLKAIDMFFGKEFAERIINTYLMLGFDSKAVEELIKKTKQFNEIENIDVLADLDIRIFNQETRAIDIVWLQYRCAVMLMAASVGDTDGIRLDGSKFETTEQLVYKVAHFWVLSGMFPNLKECDLDAFIKKTIANIIWIGNEKGC